MKTQTTSHVRLRTACLIIVLCSFVVQGLAAQRFQFRAGGDKNLQLEYVYGSVVEGVITLTLRHRGPATNYFITATAGQNAGGDVQNRRAVSTAGEFMLYQVYDGNGNVLTGTTGISGFFPEYSAGGWQDRQVQVPLRVLGSQFPFAGLYTDTFDLELYAGTSAAGDPAETQDIRLRVTMPEIVDLQVGPPGSSYGMFGRSYSIDLDPALPGVGDGAELLVLANTSFALDLSSDNGGVLRMAGFEDTLPYRLRVGSTWLSISGTDPVRVTGAEPPTGVGGRSYALFTEIDTYDTLPAAGIYTDVLNVTIVAP